MEKRFNWWKDSCIREQANPKRVCVDNSSCTNILVRAEIISLEMFTTDSDFEIWVKQISTTLVEKGGKCVCRRCIFAAMMNICQVKITDPCFFETIGSSLKVRWQTRPPQLTLCREMVHLARLDDISDPFKYEVRQGRTIYGNVNAFESWRNQRLLLHAREDLYMILPAPLASIVLMYVQLTKSQEKNLALIRNLSGFKNVEKLPGFDMFC